MTDSATVSGRVNPQSATIDFSLYGPGDATCSDSPVFQSLNLPFPVAGDSVTSAAVTPVSAGTYRWRATYSGDANNQPVSGTCNDAAENVDVSGRPVPPKPATCLGRTATIVPTAGQKVITGTEGADVIAGGNASETIASRGGNDLVCAGAGNDHAVGGAGNDKINGDAGKDRLSGESGRDLLRGGDADDTLRGGSGNDRLGGGGGQDRVYGDAGNDVLDEMRLGGLGRDRLYGGSGRDRVRTAGGLRDRVDCGSGRDSVVIDATDRQRRCERVVHAKR